MDLDRFPVAFAWTLDCCELGEVVWQTFNAAAVEARVQGVSAPPMSAKGVLVNPVLVLHDLVAQLDRREAPGHTEGTEGFVWVTGVEANPSTATLHANIRDHDLTRFDERKRLVLGAAERVRTLHPGARVEVTIMDTYANIADSLTETNRTAVDLMFTAMERLGITPKPTAMRGGTDGSWLSQHVVLTPNSFTGAHNFHSAAEFLPLPSLEQSHAMVLELISLVAQGRDLGQHCEKSMAQHPAAPDWADGTDPSPTDRRRRGGLSRPARAAAGRRLRVPAGRRGWGELPSTVAREAAGIDLAPGRVPADFLRAEVDGQVVGRVSIRHALNDFLRTIDGHIGYAVGPDFRRHGCATEILRQSVTRLNALGVDRVLVTCDDDNIASARTIERCGGVLENIWQPSTDPGNEPVKPKRRYWIG